jgi:hypothetical protein
MVLRGGSPRSPPPSGLKSTWHTLLIVDQTQRKLFSLRLGSVAGPVIQATGRSEFEGGLGSVDFVSGCSYRMSVRTGLPDHTMQTKFHSQRPSDVETPVPSIWFQKLSSIGTVSTWMGDRLMGLCSSYLQGKSWAAVGYRCCITSWGIEPMHCTTPALLSPSQWRRAKIYHRAE